MDPGVKMYFLLKMGIFQPAMLVYQRVFKAKNRTVGRGCSFLSWFEVGNPINPRNYMFFGCKWKRETPLLDEFYGGIH